MSVIYRHRAIYVVVDTNVWYWIGTHEDYNGFLEACSAAFRLILAAHDAALLLRLPPNNHPSLLVDLEFRISN